jgi:hypothetical protein
VLHTAVPPGPGFTLYLDGSVAQHSYAVNCRAECPAKAIQLLHYRDVQVE